MPSNSWAVIECTDTKRSHLVRVTLDEEVCGQTVHVSPEISLFFLESTRIAMFPYSSDLASQSEEAQHENVGEAAPPKSAMPSIPNITKLLLQQVKRAHL